MFFNQLKSLFRNKANRIYFIVMLVIFIIFNISLNLENIVYNYYNSKIEADCMEAARTITITELIELSEYDIQDIKQNEHVVDVYNKPIELSSGEIKVYCITVDNWANVNSVIQEFDEKGINSTRSLAGLIYDNLFNSYENTKILLKAVTVLIIIIDLLLFIICWKNVLKNEQKNINMLKTIGYKSIQINTINFIIIITFSIIMYISINIITNIIMNI